MKHFFILIAFLVSAGSAWAQGCVGPILTIVPSVASPCSGTSVTFTATGTHTNTLTWYVNGTNIGTNNTQSYTFPLSTTDVTYTISAVDGVACGINSNFVVRKTAISTLTGINFTQCDGSAGQSVTLYNNGGTPSNYAINWGDGNNQSVTALSIGPAGLQHNYTGQGFHTITIQATATGYCPNTKTFTVYNGTNPSVGLNIPSGTVNLCAPQNIPFPITGVSGNSLGTNYLCYVNGVYTTTYTHPPPTDFTYNFTQSSCGLTTPTTPPLNNSYLVSIAAVNPCDTSIAQVAPVRIGLRPDAAFTITPPAAPCPNNTWNFQNASTGQIVTSNNCNPPPIQWSILNGVSSIDWTVAGNFSQPSIDVTFLTPGTYTVCLTASSNQCGNDSICKRIIVRLPAHPEAQANASFAPPFKCLPNAVFNLNSNGSTGFAPLTYNWVLLDNSFNAAPVAAYSFNNTNTANPTVTITQVGNYWAKLTLGNTCNSDTALVKLKVVDKPVPTLTAFPNTCVGATNTMTMDATHFSVNNNNASTLTYNWSFPSGTPATSTAQYPSVNYAGAGTYTYTVTVTNECGSSTASASFTVQANAGVSLSGIPNPVCQGSLPFTISASASLGTWSNNAPLGVFNPNTQGTYTVTYAVTQGACSGSTSVTIVVEPLPSPSATSTTVCAGQNATLTASGGGTYAWSNAPSTTTAGLTINAATTGATYTVTVTNAAGCTATASGAITVNVIPNLSASPVSPCVTSNAYPLIATTTTAGAVLTWSGANVTSNGVYNASAAGLGTHTVTVTATANNCSTSTNVVLTVTANQVANAGANQTICYTTVLDLEMQPGVTTGGTWSISPFTNALNGHTFTPTISDAGQTYTVTLSLGAGNCLTTSTKTITVRANLSVTPTANTPCAGAALVLSVNSFSSYSWTGVNNYTSTSQNPSIANATAALAGVYTVQVTDVNNCTATASITANVNPIPTITAPTYSICNTNTAYTLAPLPTTTIAGSTFAWSGNSNLTNAGVFNAVAAGTTGSPYTITVTATAPSTGCTASATTTIAVTANITANAGADQTICPQDAAIDLNTQSGVTAGGIWTINPGTGALSSNGVFTPAQATPSTTYTVTLTLGTGDCITSNTKTIIIQALPVPLATSSPSCVDATLTLNVNGFSSYSWAGPGGFTNTAQNPTRNPATTAMNGTYTVTVTDGNGCTNTATANATVNALPVLALVPLSICKNTSPFALTATATGANPFTYNWTGTGVTTPSDFNANQSIGTYTVSCTVTDVNTCSTNGTTTVTITANDDPLITAVPNICNNASAVILVATPIGGTWSGNGTATTAGSFTPTETNVQTGNNTITYTVNISDATCRKTTTAVVNVLPLPQVTAQDTAACIGTTLKLWATTANSAAVPLGATPYSWAGPNFTSALQNPTVTTSAIAANAGIYTVTVTGANTCTNTKTINVIINPLPVVTAAPMGICKNNVQLYNLATGLPTTGGTGVWTVATGTAIANTNQFNADQSFGIYNLVYTFTDTNGCIDTAQTTLTISENNPPQLDSIPAICFNATAIDLTPFGHIVTTSPSSSVNGGEWSGIGVLGNQFDPRTVPAAGVYYLTCTLSPNDPICKKQSVLSITVKPLPQLAPTSPAACAEDTLFLFTNPTSLPATVSYNWAGPNSFASTVQNPTIPNVAISAVGIYTVTVTADNQCTNTGSTTTVVYGLPSASAADSTYCRTAGCYVLPFVSVSSAGGTYVWGSYDAASSISGVPPTTCFTPTTSGNGVFHAVATFTDTHGCIGRDTALITITEPAILSVSPRVDTACQGENVVLHGFPTGGKWYRRSVGFPDISITNDSIVNTAVLTGGGSFEYIYSLGEGSCNVKDSIKLFVVSLDSISAGANDSFCISRAPFQLIGQTPLNYTPQTAYWQNAHTNAAGVYIQNQGITSTGFYTPYAVAGADSSEVIVDTVKFVYTDPLNGCKVTRTKIITIHPLPIPANTIPDVGCITHYIRFENNSPNIATSHWVCTQIPTGTVVFMSDSTSCGHIWQTEQDTGRYQITLNVRSIFGCEASVKDTIHVVSPPFVNFAMSADSICANLPVTMTNNSSGYQVRYVWNYGDGTPQDSVQTPPPHFFRQAECDTIYNVTLTAYNLCEARTMTLPIKIFPLPIPKWDLSQDTICSGSFISFSNRTKGCNTRVYDWNLGDGTISTDSIPYPHRYYTDSLPRTYTICLHATGRCGDSTICKSIFVKPVSVKAFAIADNDRGCRPLRINFRDFSTSTSPATFTYTWDFGDGITSTLANPSHVFDSSGTFMVKVYVSNGCGFAVDSIPIIVFPQPRIGFTHPPYQCATQEMLFTNTSIDPITSVWRFDDGATSAATSPSHAFAQAGLHNVILIGKSLLNGCPDTTQQTVLIRPNPIITPTVSPSDGCGPLLVTFTTAGAPADFTYYYTWNFGDGGIAVDSAHVAIAQTVQHLYTQRDTLTNFNLGLHIIDQYQCKSDTLYSPILLYPTPTALFDYTMNPKCGVDINTSFYNLSTSTAGNLRYVWDFGDSRRSNDNSPTHHYSSSSGRIVTLTATNTYGCADSVQKRLDYCDGLFIPSAFSPETGWGEVRQFGAKGLGLKQYNLAVYSRFGNLMWQTDKIEDGLPIERWDGMFNGQIVPQDMYIWKCQAVFEDGSIWQGQPDASGAPQKVGTVTVLR